MKTKNRNHGAFGKCKYAVKAKAMAKAIVEGKPLPDSEPVAERLIPLNGLVPDTHPFGQQVTATEEVKAMGKPKRARSRIFEFFAGLIS